MHKTNWDDFRFLIAVMEEGSLNAAARRLGVNHATVLRRVTAFEEQNQVTLFKRHKSGYRLQSDQPEFVSSLSAVRKAVEAAQRAVQGQHQTISGPVKITSTDSLCEAILPRIIYGLQAAQPDLRLELLASNSHLNLAQMDAEISIRPTQALPEDLSGTEVCNLAFDMYGHREFVSEHRDKGLRDLNWLAPSSLLAKSPAGRWVKTNVPPAQRVFHTDSFLSLRNMVSTGLGLTILPCCIVRPNDQLEVFPGLATKLVTPLWVANHIDLDDLPRVRTSKEYLIQEIRAVADVLEGREPNVETTMSAADRA
ncbi:MAG: LysR family transcriptional regulator [Rhodobacteraceae bacterium]|nr:LysR family transcriptional regulator [Paracoccaceae bacterium]